MGNRGVVQRYAEATSTDDFDAQDALVHDEYVLTYPQSGEQIRGRANRRAALENYPGRGERLRRWSAGSSARTTSSSPSLHGPLGRSSTWLVLVTNSQ